MRSANSRPSSDGRQDRTREPREDLCGVPESAVELGPQTEFNPDLVTVRMDQVGGTKFTEPPLLVVEIRPPATPAKRMVP
jgi:hypothetical protein